MRNLSVFAAICGVVSTAWGQQWSYQTIGADRKPLHVGTFRLSEPSPSQFLGRIQAPDLDICFRPELKATVEKTAAQTLVVLEPLMSGCQRIRLVINNDGTGGRREVHQSDGSWKWDERERLLKPLP